MEMKFNLPSWIRKFLTAVIPFYALLIGIISISSTLIVLNISSSEGFFHTLAIMQKNGNSTALLIALVAGIIYFFSAKPLLKRKLIGWKLYFVAAIINTVANFFKTELGVIDFVFPLIVFYILIALKKEYK